MSKHYGMSVANSLNYQSNISAAYNVQDYSNGYYQLECLDLTNSVQDEEPNTQQNDEWV